MGKSSNLAYIDGVLMGCEWGFNGKTSNLTNKIQKNNTEWWNGLPESMIVEWDCHLVSRWKRNVATNQRYPQSSVVSLPKMPPLACCFFPFQPISIGCLMRSTLWQSKIACWSISHVLPWFSPLTLINTPFVQRRFDDFSIRPHSHPLA